MKLAVITGGHHFDVIGFTRLFSGLSEYIEPFIQNIDDFATSEKEIRQSYDAVLFFTMIHKTPDADENYTHQAIKTAIEELGETNQGIVVLHHAILNWPDWKTWTDIAGLNFSMEPFEYYHDEMISSIITNSNHPITQSIASWQMIDELYKMEYSLNLDCNLLIEYDTPKSIKPAAWVREYKKSRVFCYEAGHDNQTWQDANFKEVLKRGIFWVSRRNREK
jgi:uncharacterized protein